MGKRNRFGVSYTPRMIIIRYTMRVLVATTNRGKLKEIKGVLTESGYLILGLDDLDATAEPDETGTTFGENALIKARYYHSLTGLVTVADDSGLEVEELAGAPGVKSARYAGPDASDRDRIEKLLDALQDRPESRRAARFVCAAGIVWNQGQRLFVEQVRGSILTEPRGFNGFGYDPVFYYPQSHKTFAELRMDEKSRISHRGRAFQRLADWLKGALLTT